MLKVKYVEDPNRVKLVDKLKFVFKTKLFKVAIALSIIGLTLVGVAFHLHGVAIYPNNTNGTVTVSSSSPGIFQFPMLPDYPLNLTFTAPSGHTLNYSIYIINIVSKGGVNVVEKNLVTTGTATNNSVKELSLVYTPQFYTMYLYGDSPAAINVTVNSVQNVVKQTPANLYLGFSGGMVAVAGFILLAVSITRGFR